MSDEPRLCPDCWESRPCGCDELDRYMREQRAKARTRIARLKSKLPTDDDT